MIKSIMPLSRPWWWRFVVCRNHVREEHLPNTFCLDNWKNDIGGSLKKNHHYKTGVCEHQLNCIERQSLQENLKEVEEVAYRLVDLNGNRSCTRSNKFLIPRCSEKMNMNFAIYNVNPFQT